jgi:hypothetical protein
MAYEDKLLESERLANYVDVAGEPYPSNLEGKVDYTKWFPEIDEHFDFNAFVGQQPDLTTKEYNVVGGMNVADVVPSGSTWYSHPASLSALGGIYNVIDSWKEPDQDWKEGLGDWYRNVKGVGIQRDWNPLGLLYNEDEADYYKGMYKKYQNDYQKMRKLEENKILMEAAGGTFDRREIVPRGPTPSGGGGSWSPSGADLSPGGGYGQSPTGRDIAGTPFSRGGILGAF